MDLCHGFRIQVPAAWNPDCRSPLAARRLGHDEREIDDELKTAPGGSCVVGSIAWGMESGPRSAANSTGLSRSRVRDQSFGTSLRKRSRGQSGRTRSRFVAPWIGGNQLNLARQSALLLSCSVTHQRRREEILGSGWQAGERKEVPRGSRKKGPRGEVSAAVTGGGGAVGGGPRRIGGDGQGEARRFGRAERGQGSENGSAGVAPGWRRRARRPW